MTIAAHNIFSHILHTSYKQSLPALCTRFKDPFAMKSDFCFVGVVYDYCFTVTHDNNINLPILK